MSSSDDDIQNKPIKPYGPQCHILVGPMYSGKSTKQNQILTRISDTYACAGIKVTKVNHKIDKRETVRVDKKRGLTSHSSSPIGLSNTIDVQIVADIKDVNVVDYDVIGVDEAQFFGGLKDTVLSWLKLGKIVYISGLDSFSNGNICGEVIQLLPYAQTFKKLTATCIFCINNGKVGKIAMLTACKISKTNNIMVGGKNLYTPACFKCHLKHNVN